MFSAVFTCGKADRSSRGQSKEGLNSPNKHGCIGNLGHKFQIWGQIYLENDVKVSILYSNSRRRYIETFPSSFFLSKNLFDPAGFLPRKTTKTGTVKFLRNLWEDRKDASTIRGTVPANNFQEKHSSFAWCGQNEICSEGGQSVRNEVVWIDISSVAKLK